MKKIVSTGPGGVGKSSFIALLCKYLKAKGAVLLIDADPDQSLAEMVGLSYAKPYTISEIIFDVKFNKIDQGLQPFTLADKIDYLLSQKGLYEGKDFDFLSLGTKWTEGCYCQPNNILKGLISRLEKNYDYVLIDSPAGLEHLNRRITPSVDDIFAIVDPAKKAFQHIRRAYQIILDVKIKFNNFYVLANYRFPDTLLELIEKKDEFKFVGKLAYDQHVEEFNLQGKSLLEIEEDSPMFDSVKKIAAKAGI